MIGIENTMYPLQQIFGKKQLKKYTITHYTSIISLLKILESKLFKFSRIDKVNDLEEKTNLLKNENFRRVFVSCFSLETKESIPMWKMYTQYNLGVMLTRGYI